MGNREGFNPVPPIDAPEIGVGMLGYAFMGRAHTNGFKKMPYMIYPLAAIPKLVAVCGRSAAAARDMVVRFGYAGYYTDWHKMLEDDRIKLFDNGGPNNVHAAPCIAAAEAGMHILCEKPLARTAEEAKAMLDAVQKAGVKHMVAHNYRFVPALRQARDLIAGGALGRIYHYRAMYLQDWLMPHLNTERLWRMDKSIAGTGAIGDLASHIIDLGRFLVGAEIKTVSATTKTFLTERPLPDGSGMGKVDVDDAFAAAIEFENGAIGDYRRRPDGVVGMFQPVGITLYTYGFVLLLLSTLAYIVWSHVIPRSTDEEDTREAASLVSQVLPPETPEHSPKP